MAIPIETTTISLLGKRPQSAIDPDAEGYDGEVAEDDEILASEVRASITLPGGSRNGPDADAVDVYAMRCDPVEGLALDRFDRVLDETTGYIYQISRVQPSLPLAFGLEHWVATLYRTKGLSEGGGYVVPA